MSFLAHIFPLASKWLQQMSTKAEQEENKDKTNILLPVIFETQASPNIVIAGPDTATKTSFVFQAAVTTATSGLKVVHICTHPISRLPALVHGMPTPQPSVMKNVDFLYMEEATDLVAYFAGIHMKKKLPSYIIVEDILSYASQRQDKPVEKTLAKLLALFSNASTWIAGHNESGKCNVLVTAPSRIKSMQNILEQFNYDLSIYEGPIKENVFSRLSYTCQTGAQISITFTRSKDCLFLDTVTIIRSPPSHVENENIDNEIDEKG